MLQNSGPGQFPATSTRLQETALNNYAISLSHVKETIVAALGLSKNKQFGISVHKLKN